MKLVYLGASGGIVYMMHFLEPWSGTYEDKNDTFKQVYAIAPCAGAWRRGKGMGPPALSPAATLARPFARSLLTQPNPHPPHAAVLALFVNEGSIKAGLFSYAFESLWAFSIYLEAIAITPQLIMTQRHKSVENITSWYMASLGAYRGLYVLNWVYRFFTEPHYHAWIPWVAGVIQTLLYADFFYYFYHCRIKLGMKNVILPQ
jgi:hypothetical protein